MKRNPHETVNFPDQQDLILANVARHGDLADIDSWRTAFPDIKFPNVDEEFTGESIEWDSYSSLEKAIYVALMTSPQVVSLTFEINTYENGLDPEETVRDERGLFLCWFFHVFKYLDENGWLTDKALEILLKCSSRDYGDIEKYEEGIDAESMSLSHQRVI